jgi:acetylornithine deacetylase/succinyl-diaminopimelate desuccinylase-like protein
MGRGVVDMKGGVAATVAAVRGLAEIGRLSECRLELAITGDEEVGSARGVRALIATNAFHARMVVCPEPTQLDVYLGNRGTVAMEIVVHGNGGHAGLIHALNSPVGPAIRLAQAIESMPLTARDDRFDPPEPSVAITRIDAGAALQEGNVVPDTVTLTVDRRVLPREDLDAVISEITRLIEANVSSPFRADWQVIKRWPPCETASDHLVSRAARAAVQSAGRVGAFAMDLPANDTSWFVEAGIPAILLGPGDPLQAHATNESLDAEEFRDAIGIYAELVLRVGALPD